MIKGISLFSNVGIAETYLKEVGVDIVLANELIEKRARFYKHLYPECEVVNGDITDPVVFSGIVSRAKELEVEFLIATPPCQGMSIAGLMNPYDERNSLVKYAIDAIKEIQPKFVLLENVPRQMVTPIYYKDEELLKKLQSLFQTDTLKLVHIESQTCKEVLLGMDEEDFIRLAKVLPPRTTNKDED